MRLDRYLCEHAGLTRKQAGIAVRRGRVTVGGVAATDPGAHLDGEIALDGVVIAPPPALAVFHKPLGVHSTVRDERGRPSLATAAAEILAIGLHPVGRLDADTTGLLLFSRDGALTQALLHPKRAVPRTYEATVEGEPGPALVAALAAGVQTALGTFTAAVEAIDGAVVRLVVTEGKHRMVRRMLANAGHPVVALHRVAYGPIRLGDLPVGAWRVATEGELAGAG